jgi:hypothetical protein
MRTRSRGSGRRQPFLPNLEALEDRCVPSTLEDGSVRFIHGGTAVQTGTFLTVTVNKTNNTVQVLDDGAGDITVKWNGGASHFFSGIDNVTINTIGQTQTNTVVYEFTNVLRQGEAINVNLNGTFHNNFTGFMEGMSGPSGGRIQEADVNVTDNGKGSDQIHFNDVGAVTGFSTLVLNALGGSGTDNLSATQSGDITGGGNVGFNLRAGSDGRRERDSFFTSLQGNVGASGDKFGSFFESTVDGAVGPKDINDLTSNFTGTVASTGNVQMSELAAGSENNFVMLAFPSGTGTTTFSVQGNAPNGLNHAEVTPNVVFSGVQSVDVV